MATPNFTKGGTSLDFEKGAQIGDALQKTFNDNVLYSIGGIAMVESFGDVKTIFEFTTGAMTLAERDAFISFIETDIVGRKETFTYTDRDSNTYTVRLVDDSVSFMVDGPLYWIAKVTMEKVIA